MRILGVDPGIATVGFAVLDAGQAQSRLLTCRCDYDTGQNAALEQT